MAIVCNYICQTYENTTKRPGSQGYSNGLKRCRRCNYCLVTEELRCNCCHGLFKTKRTNGVNKPMYKKEVARI